MRRQLTSIMILILLSGCSAGSLSQAQTDGEKPATTTPLPNVVAVGKLIPEGDVIQISVVNAQDSRVNQLLVKEGDMVQANQIIAVLQGRDRAEQQLREAEATVRLRRAQLLRTQQGDAKQGELAAQRATIAELEARLRTETLERQAAIEEADATLRNTELTYQRNTALAQEGAIRQSGLDDAREAFEKAQAALMRSRAELDTLSSTIQAQLARERANLERLQEVRPVDLEIAYAELEQALIQVQQQRAELDDTLVRVPVAGQILRINTRVGEQVNTQEGIAELGQTNQMDVIAEVYETDIARVQAGQSVIITSEYGGFQGELRGRVEQTGLQIGKTRLNQEQSNPTTDVNARVVEVKIRLNAADSDRVAAFTGMQVRVKIDVSSTPQS